jgi:hypothetical protein
MAAITTNSGCNCERLKQVTLAGCTGAAATRSGRRGCRVARGARFGAGTNAAIGKFNFERHACADPGGGAQRVSFAIAHQRKAARQHAAIGEGGKKFTAAPGARRARCEDLPNRAVGAFTKRPHAFALLSDMGTMDREIGGDPRAQSRRQIAETIAPPLDIGA